MRHTFHPYFTSTYLHGLNGYCCMKPPKRSNRSSVISSICKPYKLNALQLKRRCWFNEPHLKTCGIFLSTILPLNPFSSLSAIVHHQILWILHFSSISFLFYSFIIFYYWLFWDWQINSSTLPFVAFSWCTEIALFGWE